MRNISQTLQNMLSGEVTTIAQCLLITLNDGQKISFTSHDHNLHIDDVIYLANSGMDLERYSENLDINSDNMQILTTLNSDIISEQDLESGKYNNAQIDLFLVDYSNPNGGKILLKSGYINRISNNNGEFIADIKSLSAKLEHEITEIYSPLCSAKLGDKKCSINRDNFRVTGTVTQVDSDNPESQYSIFYDNSRNETAGYFDYGIIEFTSGRNSGIKTEIKNYANNKLELVLPLNHTIEIEDEYVLYTGCDKKFSSCITKFNNALNFRGFPHIPGTDKMLKGAI